MRFPNVPQSVDPEVQRYLRDLSMMLEKELRARVPNTEGVREALLVSPALKVYAVRVADDGTISSTLVREP